MIESMRIRWNQFVEVAREKSPADALVKSASSYLHLNRIVVPVYNDLSSLKPVALKEEETAGLEFAVLDRDNAGSLAPKNKVASRRLKGFHNTRHGYYAYAVLRGGEIIGDIWCATPQRVQGTPIHSDLSWLGIDCGADEAYMFDLYVVPEHRGKAVTGFLLANALRHLKESGFSRVYGFYEKANLPALWIHRLFGYAEMGDRRVTRLLAYRKSEEVSRPG